MLKNSKVSIGFLISLIFAFNLKKLIINSILALSSTTKKGNNLFFFLLIHALTKISELIPEGSPIEITIGFFFIIFYLLKNFTLVFFLRLDIKVLAI